MDRTKVVVAINVSIYPLRISYYAYYRETFTQRVAISINKDILTFLTKRLPSSGPVSPAHESAVNITIYLCCINDLN